jgi:hypothetical protein
VTLTALNAELFGKVVADERNKQRRRVNTGFLRRFMENIHEPLVLLIGESGRSTGSWFVSHVLVSFRPLS